VQVRSQPIHLADMFATLLKIGRVPQQLIDVVAQREEEIGLPRVTGKDAWSTILYDEPSPHEYLHLSPKALMKLVGGVWYKVRSLLFGLYTILSLPILYGVWLQQGGSGGGHILRKSRAIVLQ